MKQAVKQLISVFSVVVLLLFGITCGDVEAGNQVGASQTLQSPAHDHSGPLSGGVLSPNGTMLRRISDQANCPLAGVGQICSVQWDYEEIDTLNAHDNTINPQRITVPAGVKYAQFFCTISLNTRATDAERRNIIWIKRNGAVANGMPVGEVMTHTTGYMGDSLTSIVYPVTPGEYFECGVTQLDASTYDTINSSGSSFGAIWYR